MKYNAIIEVKVEVPVSVEADSEPKAVRRAMAGVRALVSGVIKEKKLVSIKAVDE